MTQPHVNNHTEKIPNKNKRPYHEEEEWLTISWGCWVRKGGQRCGLRSWALRPPGRGEQGQSELLRE